MKNCPHCKAEIKQTLISNNFLLDQYMVDFINEFTQQSYENYCKSCYKKEHNKALATYQEQTEACKDFLKKNIDNVPIVTVQDPKNWNYSVISMVTSQSVTGTGVLSEITSSWSDFFGTQSGSFRSKLIEGENICKNQLRIACLELGGNAIIASDIDYSEAGAGKGMLMVCIAGTAVKASNLSEMGYNAKIIAELEANTKKLFWLSSFNPRVNFQ